MYRLAVIVKLKRDADDVIALALHQPGDDGGIDPARHGHHDPGVLRALGEIETVEHTLDPCGVLPAAAARDTCLLRST
ncbi:hypothetical protein GCM10007285_13570 [Stappia taiwanensis]|nr:hypothetical protein GCM10007285_13570 [Stappia taiwanensis]